MFLSHEYFFFCKFFGNWTLQGQNWPIQAKIGPNLDQNGQYPFKWPRESNETNFPHVSSTENEYFKIWT